MNKKVNILPLLKIYDWNLTSNPYQDILTWSLALQKGQVFIIY